MPTSKEELRQKYHISADDFDVLTALALRPSCEHCERLLPADSLDARICSFECTFCASCVDSVLGNVCPNCGGGFAPRPIRPATNWRNGNYLGAIPASAQVTHRRVKTDVHEKFSAPIRWLPPERR